MGKDEIDPSKAHDQRVATFGSRRSGVEKTSTYYNLPLIKKAHWGWEIYLYFYLGGIAGGSYLVATLADLFGLKKARELSVVGATSRSLYYAKPDLTD